MSPILQDVQADFIFPELKAANGRQVLKTLAHEVAIRTALDAEMIYDDLIAQEQKSASGIGGGVAIPHMQMEELHEPIMILARLDNPLDFHAVDQQAVDLVFLLLSPAQDGPLHLRRLSRISRLLKSQQLRTARDAHTMRAIMTEPEDWLIAA